MNFSKQYLLFLFRHLYYIIIIILYSLYYFILTVLIYTIFYGNSKCVCLHFCQIIYITFTWLVINYHK